MGVLVQLPHGSYSSDLVTVGDNQVKPDQWVAFLFKYGRIVPLFPTFLETPCGSRDEVIERIRIKLALNPEARQRWAGCHIVPVNFAEYVSINADGSIR